MKSKTTERFRKAFSSLPAQVQQQARKSYQRFSVNPAQPSLRFKQVHPSKPIYSARVGLGYRAIGVIDGETIIWFWIGSHAEYDKLLSQI